MGSDVHMVSLGAIGRRLNDTYLGSAARADGKDLTVEQAILTACTHGTMVPPLDVRITLRLDKR